MSRADPRGQSADGADATCWETDAPSAARYLHEGWIKARTRRSGSRDAQNSRIYSGATYPASDAMPTEFLSAEVPDAKPSRKSSSTALLQWGKLIIEIGLCIEVAFQTYQLREIYDAQIGIITNFTRSSKTPEDMASDAPDPITIKPSA